MFENPFPGELVQSAPPRVTLRNAWAHPFDSAIAAARTCYAPRLIGPEEITDKQRLNIGAATFHSGHHTVYQHAHFEFGLENISRQFVWSFLHAHPFYNSEQQSQRYVRLDRAQAYVPPVSLFFDEKCKEIYEGAIARAWNSYRELSSLLVGDTRNILNDIWHIGPMSHPKRLQKIERSAEKRAIEIARYVLPLAAFTTMVHTISGIVLHRLWRMCAASDTPSEARAVIGAMVAHVKEMDAQFFDRFGTEPLDELPEWKNVQQEPAAGEPFAREFDAQLNGRTSKIVDYSPNAVRVIAESFRAVAGLTAAQSLPPRNSQRRGPRPDNARSPARQLHFREKNQPYRRQPGPAPSHGPRLAPAPHPRRHARARLHHACAPCRQSPRQRSLRPRHARR